ncbi:MAG: carboxypeptidase-like regulatory domain-containing protein, partial [Oscillospiraceae bacterium]|nr:carboxypeptidase-like regulatory domain-containing protein [Oscillospiraceae bacterium]
VIMNMYSDEGKVEQYTNEMLRMYRQQNADRENNLNNNLPQNSNQNKSEDVTNNSIVQSVGGNNGGTSTGNINNHFNINQNKFMSPWIAGQDMPPASYRQDISPHTIRGDMERQYGQNKNNGNMQQDPGATSMQPQSQSQPQSQAQAQLRQQSQQPRGEVQTSFDGDNTEILNERNGARDNNFGTRIATPRMRNMTPDNFAPNAPFTSNAPTTKDIPNDFSSQPFGLDVPPAPPFSSTPIQNSQSQGLSESDMRQEPGGSTLPTYMTNPMEFQGEQAMGEWKEFESNNPSNGFLKVQVYSAQGALPVRDARIIVSKQFGNQSRIFYEMMTDESGVTDPVSLPAPDNSHSFVIDGVRPYETYDLEVFKPGFRTIVRENMPVFPGIVSLQPIQMRPLLSSEQDDEVEDIVE